MNIHLKSISWQSIGLSHSIFNRSEQFLFIAVFIRMYINNIVCTLLHANLYESYVARRAQLQTVVSCLCEKYRKVMAKQSTVLRQFYYVVFHIALQSLRSIFIISTVTVPLSTRVHLFACISILLVPMYSLYGKQNKADPI